MPETAIANSRAPASTKDGYLALVDRRFRAADPDGDGTLDAKELGSKGPDAADEIAERQVVSTHPFRLRRAGTKG
jgi:hypothetical protein